MIGWFIHKSHHHLRFQISELLECLNDDLPAIATVDQQVHAVVIPPVAYVVLLPLFFLSERPSDHNGGPLGQFGYGEPISRNPTPVGLLITWAPDG